MKEFCNLNDLKSLTNEPTCFKNPEKPTYKLTNIFPIKFLRLICQTFICGVTEFQTNFTKSNGFHQVKWISPSQTDFTKSDGFHQVRRISPSQMDFTKSNGFHQVKWISPSLRPRIITYRDNKNFNKAFRSEIQSLCSREADLGFFKTLFFTFSINMVISKGIFAQMKPLL